MFTHFYHRLIRKYVVIFGTLFNGLYLTRYTQDRTQKETFKVPLAYGPKERWLTRIQSDPNLTKSVMVTVPRLSFEIDRITYDPERKQQNALRFHGPPAANNSVKGLYTGAPYNIDFTLNFYARNIEDGTQIAEQILPYFQPDFIVSATLVPDMELKRDIPIHLTGVSQTIDYEGPAGAGSTRLIIWQFNFTLKGYFFGPSANTGIIMGDASNSGNTGGVIANLYNDSRNLEAQIVYVTHISTQDFIEGETVRSHRHTTSNVHSHASSAGFATAVGTVLAWDRPRTKLTLVGGSRADVFNVHDVIIGDTSHASATANTTEVSIIKTAIIKIQQDPLSANASSDFGYSEQLTEFPDTL